MNIFCNKFKRILCAFALCLMSLPSYSMVLYSEDWNSGVMNTTTWFIYDDAGQSGGVMQLDQIAPGDYAMGMAHPYNFDLTLWSQKRFNRGNNLRVSFLVWGDLTNDVGGQLFPNVSNCYSGWHHNNDYQGYNYEEVMLDWYYKLDGSEHIRFIDTDINDPDYGTNRSAYVGGSTNFAVSAAFEAAFVAATSRANAMTIRIGVGDTNGGILEWSTDGINFTTEYDTRDTHGYTAVDTLYLGFMGIQGYIYVDDIVVEDDSTPPSPTEVVFSEDWSSGVMDTATWSIYDDPNQSGGVMQLDQVSPGDYAMGMAHPYNFDLTLWS